MRISYCDLNCKSIDVNAFFIQLKLDSKVIILKAMYVKISW